MLHFQPGAKFLQITTTGCNFSCPGCISTVLVREMTPDSRAFKHLSADQVIAMAVETGCQGIVFLMNDPLAALRRFLRIAELAHARGLKVGCSSNTYFTPESLTQLLPCLDFINIGMKGFSDAAYRACGVPGIRPVLRNLAALHGRSSLRPDHRRRVLSGAASGNFQKKQAPIQHRRPKTGLNTKET